MGFDKKVVDEVSGWLRVYDDGSIDRSWAGPLEVGSLVTPVPPSKEFVDGVATHDVIIDPDSNLSVRIYVPEKQPLDDPKLPIILHFHGGGFCVSRADWYMYDQFYAWLVKSARAICVSVELRLAPDHRLPAAIDDCYAALLRLRSLAQAELHEPWLEAADFSRVFPMGDSSGRNLVHEVAARAGSEEWEPLRLAGGVPIHPGLSVATDGIKGSPLHTTSSHLLPKTLPTIEQSHVSAMEIENIEIEMVPDVQVQVEDSVEAEINNPEIEAPLEVRVDVGERPGEAQNGNHPRMGLFANIAVSGILVMGLLLLPAAAFLSFISDITAKRCGI